MRHPGTTDAVGVQRLIVVHRDGHFDKLPGEPEGARVVGHGRRFGKNAGSGLSGQFWIGALLGAVWSPCVGPTLGAASILAAQGRDLPQVAITMFAFGVGAALPLLALGLVSREVMLGWRQRLLSAGHGMKTGLGLLFVVTGGWVLLGLDKRVETFLVDASPQWLTNLTTRFLTACELLYDPNRKSKRFGVFVPYAVATYGAISYRLSQQENYHRAT